MIFPVFGLLHLHAHSWQYTGKYWVILNVSDIVFLFYFLEHEADKLLIYLAYQVLSSQGVVLHALVL